MSLNDLIAENHAEASDSYKDKKYRSEDWLREQYITEGRSQNDIAEECDVHRTTIRRWREKLCIKKKYKFESWMKEQYVDEDRTLADIAEEFDVATTTIEYWRDKFGISKGKNVLCVTINQNR